MESVAGPSWPVSEPSAGVREVGEPAIGGIADISVVEPHGVPRKDSKSAEESKQPVRIERCEVVVHTFAKDKQI